MPFRSPLTADDLRAIRAKYEALPGRAPCSYQDKVVWEDILALQHEIKRLRALVLTAYQLRESFRPPGNCLDTVWHEFQQALHDEPCVQELGELKRELLDPTERRARPKKTSVG